jgi:hypothetical protein
LDHLSGYIVARRLDGANAAAQLAVAVDRNEGTCLPLEFWGHLPGRLEPDTIPNAAFYRLSGQCHQEMEFCHHALLVNNPDPGCRSTTVLLEFYRKYGTMKSSLSWALPNHLGKEDEMSEQKITPQERATRGKRLLLYGMFSLVVVTIVAVFLTTWLILAPLGQTGAAIRISLIIGAVAIVACVIVWFVYTKLILKE